MPVYKSDCGSSFPVTKKKLAAQAGGDAHQLFGGCLTRYRLS
jgi:hypothetical protein